MKVYMFRLFLLVAIANTSAHNLYAADLVPIQPEHISSGPVISLPPHYDYATRLLHLYNAQVDNANFRIPRIDEIMDDSKRGLQAWLSCLPDASAFTNPQGYALYRSSGDVTGDNHIYVIFLPDSKGTMIEQHIQERLQRFVHHRCLADGFPEPRIGKVHESDYHIPASTHIDAWLTPLFCGVFAAIALLLLLSLRQSNAR